MSNSNLTIIETRQIVAMIRATSNGAFVATTDEAMEVLEGFVRIRLHEQNITAIRELTERYDGVMIRIASDAHKADQ